MENDFLRAEATWKRIRENEAYKPLIGRLRDEYELYCRDKPIPQILFSDEVDFIKTGNRTRFENLYFTRRRQLSLYAMYSMLYPETDEYIIKLQDVICEICNEYSWQLPAHRPAFYPNKRDGLALFSCETGLYLAEIKHMLFDRLDPLVTERITNELDRRILKSFESETTWIEELKSNWAAVCGGCIGMTFMYESPERFFRVQPRIERFMDNYRDGISSDGATSEGAGYWNYGFSFYMMYYDNLRRFSRGRGKNGLNDAKMKLFAGFFNDLILCDGTVTSFSDSSPLVNQALWLGCFIKREYDIDRLPLDMCYIGTEKFSETVRAFLYYDPESISRADVHERLFEELGWYIKRNKSFGFAVKAGNNGEEHNHNDIGSFIIAKDGKELLCDLGAAEYTASNFGKDRYKVFNNSSLGHSVPIVNGSEQGTGKDFFGTLDVAGSGITVDMKNAYPVPVKKLIRHFELHDDIVRLTDKFDSDLKLIERFITEVKPKAEGNTVIIDNAVLSFNKCKEPLITEKHIKAHDGKTIRKVYMIDLIPETDTFELVIKI